MLTFKNLIHHFVVPLPQRGRLKEPLTLGEVAPKVTERARRGMNWLRRELRGAHELTCGHELKPELHELRRGAQELTRAYKIFQYP